MSVLCNFLILSSGSGMRNIVDDFLCLNALNEDNVTVNDVVSSAVCSNVDIISGNSGCGANG